MALECRVTEIKPLGSHDMFIAEILAVNADSRYIDSKGKINLNQAGLMAYSHGEYFSLGRKLGSFGYSVAKGTKRKANVKHQPVQRVSAPNRLCILYHCKTLRLLNI